MRKRRERNEPRDRSREQARKRNAANEREKERAKGPVGWRVGLEGPAVEEEGKRKPPSDQSGSGSTQFGSVPSQ